MAIKDNEYNPNSIRWRTWDYRNDGIYFITICTNQRNQFFAEILDGEMQLSEIGKLAEKYWLEIPEHFKNVSIDEYVIMPDHMHGILILRGMGDQITQNDLLTDIKASTYEEMVNSLIEIENMWRSRNEYIPRRTMDKEYFSEISPKAGSISSIIRSYKFIVARECKRINTEFKWQERFHDRVIRHPETMHWLRKYVLENPMRWKDKKSGY